MSSLYELTVVHSPDLSDTKHKQALTALQSLVKKKKGKVVTRDDWGKRQLAYPIQKHSEGHFTHWVVELPAGGPGAATSELELDELVIRYLLVKVDKEAKKSAPKRASATGQAKKSKVAAKNN